jgi:uncharacterized protein YecE (DUF72 family)
VPLFIGTSGFDYPEWKGEFYPADLRRADFLEHYSSRFNACEINTTFYGLQKKESVQRWTAATPVDFRFAVKTHRRLTHTKQFRSEGYAAFLTEFFETLEGFGEKLACLLVQFPPTRERDLEALAYLLERMPLHLRCAVEFRHESWGSADVEQMVAEAGGTVCVSDTTGQVPGSLPAGPLGYVRLRGEHYTDDQREGWRRLLTREAENRDVFAFGKHKDVPANDPHVGAGFAEWLSRETCS